MAFKYRNNLRKSYIFIFLLISTEFFSIYVEGQDLSRFDLPARYDKNRATDEFGSLISVYNPLQLHRGTPDMLPPPFLRDALSNLTRSSDVRVHQYLPPQGSLELRAEIAHLYSILISRPLDPIKNVIVTVGATEALYLTLLLHTLPGDEWIVIEPAYNNYYNTIKMTGGTVRSIRFKPRITEGKLGSGDLVLDEDELRNAFNLRTKGIIVNNPQNPTGKIFTREELMFIAKLAEEWNTLIISDEVYEWTIFDSNKYIRMASLGPKTFNRTISISSMSKTYFATGWRVGWAYGPSKLIGNLIAPQQFVVLNINSYVQLAAAEGLRKMRHELGHPDSYFNELAKSLESRRNYMVDVLSRIGMEPIIPQSGYYIFANWTRLEPVSIEFDREEGNSKDNKFIKWLIKNPGIAAAPGSAYYDNEGKKIGQDFIRVCFAKKFETLERAAASLLNQLVK